MDKKAFKEIFLEEISKDNYNRWEAIKYLNKKLEWLHKGYDSIIEENGYYVFYNHERKHSNKEEHGEKLTDYQVGEYLALTEVLEGLKEYTINPLAVKWSY